MIMSRSIHVAANGIISFFIVTECVYICMYALYVYIPCVYVCVCVCVCVYMCHIYFIHSSVSGHLGCSHVLAIISSVAVVITVHGSF